MLNIFKAGFRAGGMGSFAGMLGAGAIVQGFRAIMAAAQNARTEAKELGTTVDAATASVAAYADRWDQIKESIADAGIAALGFFTRTGRAIGQALGTGSSDAEFGALETNKDDQKQREKDLKANGERINREIAAARKERSEATRSAQMAGLTEKERELALEKEIFSLFEKRAGLLPQSLEAIRTDTEIQKRQRELTNLQNQRRNRAPTSPSELTDRGGAFGLTVKEVATMNPVGRRSERERIAGEVMALEERARRAEASGNGGLARALRTRATSRAGAVGFHNAEGGATNLRRGSSFDAGIEARNAAIDSGIAARNAALATRTGIDRSGINIIPGSTPAAQKRLDKAMQQDPTAQAVKWALENASTLRPKSLD
ncbi:MAG TPA: hypothetical protein VLH79_06840 [Chthonomonadales bacterium]|nr:hypothetical protein [Chthonomonadales bacterium]